MFKKKIERERPYSQASFLECARRLLNRCRVKKAFSVTPETLKFGGQFIQILLTARIFTVGRENLFIIRASAFLTVMEILDGNEGKKVQATRNPPKRR